MNQMELNKIAINFIQKQSLEVAKKLKGVLADDLRERAKEIGGPAVHYVHNRALFDTLLVINCLFTSRKQSQEAVQEYQEYAETLRSNFLDIVESLQDFEPTSPGPDGDEASG